MVRMDAPAPADRLNRHPTAGVLRRVRPERHSPSGRFFSTARRSSMNKDQVKGAAKEVEGKIQKNVGEATDNASQQAKGLGKEAAGKVQKNYGDAKEDIKDANKDND
jgi:uncharacterized protein YjbJ (UPF0337 family)